MKKGKRAEMEIKGDTLMAIASLLWLAIVAVGVSVLGSAFD